MISADQPKLFPAELRVVVTSRDDGSVKFGGQDSDATIRANLERLCAQNGLSPEQVIGQRITYDEARTYDVIQEVEVSSSTDLLDKNTWVEADALITTQRATGLLLPVADCNAVVVYDPAHRLVSLAHIGWHAATANLPQKLIQHLHAKYGSDPAKLLVYISPSIRPASYFNPDPVQKDDPAWQRYLHSSEGQYHVDIFGFVRDQLLEAGVQSTHLEASIVDVGTSNEYFSHFAAKQSGDATGRFAVICWLT